MTFRQAIKPDRYRRRGRTGRSGPATAWYFVDLGISLHIFDIFGCIWRYTFGKHWIYKFGIFLNIFEWDILHVIFLSNRMHVIYFIMNCYKLL